MVTMFHAGTGPSGSVMQSLSAWAWAWRGSLRAVALDPSATIVANTTLSAITARTERRLRQGRVSEPHPNRVTLRQRTLSKAVPLKLTLT